MGHLLREVQEDGYDHPPHDLIPELMLLGTVETVELCLAEGNFLRMSVIRYKGRNWIMKMEKAERWFDERRR